MNILLSFLFLIRVKISVKCHEINFFFFSYSRSLSSHTFKLKTICSTICFFLCAVSSSILYFFFVLVFFFSLNFVTVCKSMQCGRNKCMPVCWWVCKGQEKQEPEKSIHFCHRRTLCLSYLHFCLSTVYYQFHFLIFFGFPRRSHFQVFLIIAKKGKKTIKLTFFTILYNFFVFKDTMRCMENGKKLTLRV